MKLIIVRHGETEENVKGICQGQTPGTLTPKGIEQAKKLALRLKSEHIDAAYSSDQKRASDTAKQILKFHPHLKLQLDKRLRERSLGHYEGHPFPKDWDWKSLPNNVESDKMMVERLRLFVNDIAKNHPSQTVLVVCHGGTKYALLSAISPTLLVGIGSLLDFKNTSISVVEITKDKRLVHLLNCTKHLE